MKNVPYDSIAEEYYDSSHKTSRNFDQATIAALQIQRARVPAGGLILDIGAGRGRCNEFLGVDPKRVIQLDSSQSMLHVQPREECLIKVLHNAEHLPFLDSEFSCVTAFLCDPYIGLNVLAEVFRVLSDGGLFIATTPSYEWGAALRNELQIDSSLTRFVTKRGSQVFVPSILIPGDRLIDMIEVAGFERSKVQLGTHKLPPNAIPVSDDISIPASRLGMDLHDLAILYSIIAEK
jgi:Methylase involved in ubiquinone/menaquinone biosynthesis